MSHKLTDKDLQIICREKGLEYLGGYSTSMQKFKYKCSCGNITEGFLSSIRNGSKCMSCSGAIKYTQLEVETELKILGLELVSEYQNSRDKLTYICNCGSIGKTNLGHIRLGMRCGHCKEFKWKQEFLSHNCEVISYCGPRDIIYKCYCGKSHTVQASNFIRRKGKCPDSPREIVKISLPVPKRPSLNTWKKHVLLRDNCTCQKCELEFDLNVHHIEAYSIRPDLMDDIDNGIVLCYDCHTEVHSKFGYNVGRNNLNSWLASTI